jgi:hypothetical protein
MPSANELKLMAIPHTVEATPDNILTISWLGKGGAGSLGFGHDAGMSFAIAGSAGASNAILKTLRAAAKPTSKDFFLIDFKIWNRGFKTRYKFCHKLIKYIFLRKNILNPLN